MTDHKERTGGGFLLRQPFALLGAIALLSLVQDLLQWQEWINTWIDAFQAVTRPVWNFLLGWFFEWVGWEFPWWVKDYLTVVLIVYGMSARGLLFQGLEDNDLETIVGFIIAPIIWPVTIPWVIIATYQDKHPSFLVFWETAVWTLIIIAVNYALVFGGA